MKRVLLWVLAVTICISMVATFSLVGCTQEAAETTEAVEEEAVEEEAVEEEAVEEDSYSGVTDLKIGFSTCYSGNSYRQNLNTGFENTMEDLKSQGIVDSWIMTDSNNDTATQISDIQSMILDEVDAIVLVAGSTTAFTDAIQQAIDAGIPVISINQGPLETDLVYEIIPDWKETAVFLAEYAVDVLKEKQGTEDVNGNVLIVRGFTGEACDTYQYAGHTEVLAQNPGLEIAAEVYGQWTHSVALSEIEQVLPSLPDIDMVLGQGGDGYAAVLAFENAGRDLPIIVGGNRGDFLNWWMDEYNENGYDTASSCGNPTGMGSAAGYLAVEILNGNTDFEHSRIMMMPSLNITLENLFDFEGISDDVVAGQAATWDDVKTDLMTQIDVQI